MKYVICFQISQWKVTQFFYDFYFDVSLRPSCTYNSQILISQLIVTQPLLSSLEKKHYHNNTYFHCLATRTFLKCKSVKGRKKPIFQIDQIQKRVAKLHQAGLYFTSFVRKKSTFTNPVKPIKRFDIMSGYASSS